MTNQSIRIPIEVFFILLIMPISSLAQEVRFINSGIIEYEKRSNMYAVIGRQLNKKNGSGLIVQFDEYKKSNPQFKIAKSILQFSNNKTLFTPTENGGSTYGAFDTEITNQRSVIYTDFDTGISIAEKAVFEQTFLLTDSTRKINWKITNETRDILGYPCRRANAIIMDSIYVVAFFTNDILVTGGPESFTGLPGMILGVALPHENISWFATQIKDISVPSNAIKPPQKGKPVNINSLKMILNSALKEWGPYKQSYLKAFLL